LQTAATIKLWTGIQTIPNRYSTGSSGARSFVSPRECRYGGLKETMTSFFNFSTYSLIRTNFSPLSTVYNRGGQKIRRASEVAL